jgi:hypothetical protein
MSSRSGASFSVDSVIGGLCLSVLVEFIIAFVGGTWKVGAGDTAIAAA